MLLILNFYFAFPQFLHSHKSWMVTAAPNMWCASLARHVHNEDVRHLLERRHFVLSCPLFYKA
jgi:hypothetical protein